MTKEDFRSKPPKKWSEEELIAFRDKFYPEISLPLDVFRKFLIEGEIHIPTVEFDLGANAKKEEK